MYEGERDTEGEPHGKGTMKYATGDRYEGEWKHGEEDGWGTWKSAGGDAYEGEFTARWTARAR